MFFCLLLFEATFTSFFIDKKLKVSGNQGFCYYVCMMIEGSGAGSGSVPLTNGSRWPKNIWIRRIQIRNTVSSHRLNPARCSVAVPRAQGDRGPAQHEVELLLVLAQVEWCSLFSCRCESTRRSRTCSTWSWATDSSSTCRLNPAHCSVAVSRAQGDRGPAQHERELGDAGRRSSQLHAYWHRQTEVPFVFDKFWLLNYIQ